MACDYEVGLLLVIDVHMNLRTRRVLEMPRTLFTNKEHLCGSGACSPVQYVCVMITVKVGLKSASGSLNCMVNCCDHLKRLLNQTKSYGIVTFLIIGLENIGLFQYKSKSELQ